MSASTRLHNFPAVYLLGAIAHPLFQRFFPLGQRFGLFLAQSPAPNPHYHAVEVLNTIQTLVSEI